MGSMGETSVVVGQYMHPVIDDNTPDSDPWQRGYYVPPPHNTLVPRSYPLIDIRPELKKPNYTPEELLRTHGFAVVKHESQVVARRDLSDHVVANEYLPEIKDLVKKVTGAKTVLVQLAGKRVGKSAPEPYQIPTKANIKFYDADKDKPAKDQAENNQAAATPHKPKIATGAPVRVPHLDMTPLGARQAIRLENEELHKAAVESGVIAAEDELVRTHEFKADTEEANPVIAEGYNRDGKLGPRYAAYSIWRPLHKVGRDPITLSPRRETEFADGERVHWPYFNRLPATPGFTNGDWLKQFAQLGVKGKEPPLSNVDHPLKFYYVSRQEPDEVTFIRLFDSASLGPDSQHAGAPYHASPEIGNVEGDQARESIEVRVFAVW